MTELSNNQQARWHSRLTAQREKCGRTQDELVKLVGRSAASISRFENGDPGRVRSWLTNGLAELYATAIGIDLATLKRWRAEIEHDEQVHTPWHEAFPDVAAADVQIVPPLRIIHPTGLSDIDGLITHLKSIKGQVRVQLIAPQGHGGSTVSRWLLNYIGADPIIERMPRAPSNRPAAPAGDAEVRIEVLPWGPAEIRALASRLLQAGEVESEQEQLVQHLADRLEHEKLSLGAATAIGTVARAIRNGLSEGSLTLAIAEAQWAWTQKKCGKKLAGIDSEFLLDFWATRRLLCPGETWTAPTSEEAVSIVASLLAARKVVPPDPAILRERLASVRQAKPARRDAMLEEVEALFDVADEDDVLQAMLATGLLVVHERWLAAPDRQLAEAYAAEALKNRPREIVARTEMAWALDPSWRPMLSRLGQMSADPRPLLDQWRTAPLPILIEGVIAVVHLIAAADVTKYGNLAPIARQVQAVALYALVTLGLSGKGWLPRGEILDLTRVLQELSRRWAPHLRFFGEHHASLAERVPVEMRRQLSERAPQDHEVDAKGILVCLAPWQCPPLDLESFQHWHTAPFRNGVEPFLPSPPHHERVLEAAADNGHPRAVALLTGVDPEGGVDVWAHLSWELRCRKLGGRPDQTGGRLAELCEEAQTQDELAPLLEAAARVGRVPVDLALRILSAPKVESWGRSAPWVWQRPKHARCAVKIAVAAGARGALAQLCESLRRRAEEMPPQIPGFDARRSPHLGEASTSDSGDIAAAREDIRQFAHLGNMRMPGWVDLAAPLLAESLQWESIRHEIALAVRGRMPARAENGPGWEWSGADASRLDCDALRVRLGTRQDPWSLYRLLQNPAPEQESQEFLDAVLRRQRERSAAWTKLGIASASPDKLERPDIDIRWLEERARELQHLPQLLGYPSGAPTSHSIDVLAWFLHQDGALLRQEDIPDALWQWFTLVAGTAREPAFASTAAAALKWSVQIRACRVLIEWRDPKFLAALSSDDMDLGALHQIRREVEDRLPTDAPLRHAVWTHGNGHLRYRALRLELETGSPSMWAQRAQDAENEHSRAAILGSTPEDQLLCALHGHQALTPTEAERIVLEHWSIADSSRLPHHHTRFGAYELLEFARKRIEAGSLGMIPAVLELWHDVLRLPIGPDQDGATPPDALPATMYAPPLWDRIVSLLRAGGQAQAVVDAWNELDPSRVHAELADVAKWQLHWADEDDRKAPLTRIDLHRAWLIALAPDLLRERVALDRAGPGLGRVLAREHAYRENPDALADWLRLRVLTIDPGQLGPEAYWWWILWSQVRPAEGWAWLTSRWENHPSARPDLGELARDGVIYVEAIVPEARLWLSERTAL